MTPPAPPRRARLLGISVLSAVFVAGALAGAASGRLLDAREASAVTAPPAPAQCQEGRGRLVDRIDLSPAQRAQVDSIVERRRAQREDFWDNEGKRMRVIMDSTRNEIRAVMTPEQRAEYDRLVAEHRARGAARDSAKAPSAGSGR